MVGDLNEVKGSKRQVVMPEQRPILFMEVHGGSDVASVGLCCKYRLFF